MVPIALLRCFADSRLEVESFTRLESTLAIRIEKDIGPETGIMTFRQVSFLSLTPVIEGDSIQSRPVSEAGPDFWSVCRLARDWFDRDDLVFEIESPFEPVSFIVAKSLSYDVVMSVPELDQLAGIAKAARKDGYRDRKDRY
jgi:hypothetical protein